MNKARQGILISLYIIGALFTASAQDTINPKNAIKYIGEVKVVCGKVASTKYATTSNGKPTFLNLDHPYPDHIFTIVIWQSDRLKFDQPEEHYMDKNVCVTGRITSYRDKPQITAKSPDQISIQ